MRITNVNIDIAFTHIFTRKRQTIVAALGVMIGIAIYLFMTSVSAGFSRYSRNEIFKSSSHIKIYKEEAISEPLLKSDDKNYLPVIVNPQILTESKKIINPRALLQTIKQQPYITNAIAQVNADVFYTNGKSQLRGTANGVEIKDADAMFDIKSYMLAGDLMELQSNRNAIVIGKGIADKLNLNLNDNITITSSMGVDKLMKVRGIFSTGNSYSDLSRSYLNIHTAQQLLKEGISYVTVIYANTTDYENAPGFAEQMKPLTPYTVEAWQVTNADILSGEKVRDSMMSAITFTILIVAAFGIYNILNMTVMQKLNDIAILKATGFNGKDVVVIFVLEAMIMGVLGCLLGLGVGSLLIFAMANTYMGPPVGYFPVAFEFKTYLQSFIMGTIVTFCAGYIPARKAAKVDPVEIFRR